MSSWACDLAACQGPDLKRERSAPQRQVSADEEKGQAVSLRSSPGQRRAIADIVALLRRDSDAPLDRVGAGRDTDARLTSPRDKDLIQRTRCALLSSPADIRDRRCIWHPVRRNR